MKKYIVITRFLEEMNVLTVKETFDEAHKAMSEDADKFAKNNGCVCDIFEDSALVENDAATQEWQIREIHV